MQTSEGPLFLLNRCPFFDEKFCFVLAYSYLCSKLNDIKKLVKGSN